MKSLLVSLLLIASTNVLAVSLEFKFEVNSSGPSIYPCDAGLRHRPHQERVCYNRVTQESCNPSACTDEVQCNCVCTADSQSDAGEYRHDFMNVSYADWTENGEFATNIQSVSIPAKKDSFNRVFSDRNEWNKQLTKMTINLGSERYGAEYYVDVCYRGPQIEYFQAGSLSDTPNFLLKAQATVTDINTNNGMQYSDLADLKVKAKAVCDQQGMGSYIYAHDGSGNYDNPLAHQITNNMKAGDGQFVYKTGYNGFNTGSNLYLINEWINVNNNNTPRFCKVRYTFKENRRNKNDLLSQIRKWKIQQSEICTYTSINEDI